MLFKECSLVDRQIAQQSTNQYENVITSTINYKFRNTILFDSVAVLCNMMTEQHGQQTLTLLPFRRMRKMSGFAAFYSYTSQNAPPIGCPFESSNKYVNG